MAKKKASADILNIKEMSDLLCQHVAIRSQMRFLIKGLDGISVQSKQDIAPSTVLNERVILYLYSLDDFQEAIKRHNELYEHIEMLLGSVINEDIKIEHKEIEKQLDDIVCIAHDAVNCALQQDELSRHVSDIIEGVNRICKSIDLHMAREEGVLE